MFLEGHTQSEVGRLLAVPPDAVWKYIERYLSAEAIISNVGAGLVLTQAQNRVRL